MEAGAVLSKYKVGDRVRIRPDLEAGKWYGDSYVAISMARHAGEVVTIKKYSYDHRNMFFVAEELEGCVLSWLWSEEMMEGLAEPKQYPYSSPTYDPQDEYDLGWKDVLY